MSIKYNKLIRDKIPEIIREKGKQCIVVEASTDEYRTKLKEKLLEEVNEFLENPCLEELADIQEVVSTLEEEYNWGSLTLARLDKRIERGAFKKKLILKEVS